MQCKPHAVRLLFQRACVLMLCGLSLVPVSVDALTISLGELEVSANFTLNPAFNFNHPTAQPFGSFSNLMVTQATGIFATSVANGDVFMMTTPDVSEPPFTALISDKPLAGQMLWSLGNFTIDTNWTNITGADSGRHVLGLFDLAFGSFNFANDPFLNGVQMGNLGSWEFIAPPYDISSFTTPITGPITLKIHELFVDARPVPEPSSMLLLACAAAVLVGWRSVWCWIGLDRGNPPAQPANL